MNASPGACPVVPVSLLVSSARLLIERHLGLAWISGEVSNFTRAASGHAYFLLKDAQAQVPLRAVSAQGAAAGLRPGRRDAGRGARHADHLRGARRISAQCRDGAPGRRGRALRAVRAAEGASRSGRLVRPGAQAPPAAISARGRHRHLAARGGAIRCADHARAPNAVLAGHPLPRLGPGRRRRGRGGRRDRCRQCARRSRRPDRLPRRRLDRGSVGVQRGSSWRARCSTRAFR